MSKLLAALAVEIVVFAAIAPNFLTTTNLFEVTRLSVELGLLAAALTPVLVTGGIDLSVGSMMGLAAVLFGAATIDWHLPVPIAAAIALVAGLVGGALNGLLVSRFGIPPLIVTLGTLSLFRGIAEGLTQGAVNYSGFPAWFLFFGQGYLGGVVPTQLPLFVIVVGAYWLLLHRSVVGRAWYAIGFSPGGARHAGLAVVPRVRLVYMLSGLTASLAAIIYVSHLGQAKSDAGTGYELDAITAAVLGGTSVFGGRGTIAGTLLGLAALATLQNGFHLAALPSELTGVVTAALLISTIAIDRISTATRSRPTTVYRQPGPGRLAESELIVKNSQVAVLCGAILAGSLLVAGTNVWLIRSIKPSAATGEAVPGKRLTIAMMPKAKGDPYFVSCRAGAEEAARELGVDLIWDGPTGLDAAKQSEVVENWITRKVDAIAVSVENRESISPVLRKARERGIRVVTWDADAEPLARDFFINQATPEGIGNALTDEAARLMNGSGSFAIITGALSAANQNAWMRFINSRLRAKYPRISVAVVRPSDDDRDKAFAETQTALKVYPALKLVMAISAPAVPGAAEAVRQAGRSNVSVIGLSLPNMNKPYVHGGIVQTIVLWNTKDLGYLTVHAAARLAGGGMRAGSTSFSAGRLGSLEVKDGEIILGLPLLITKQNIDTFDF
jgi:rhamnose transport system substrate-binding protein/rhamnose transport system permease protein